jgi:hypothetical protein
MADIGNFLFGGTAPESVTKYGKSATDTPAWYSDYTQGLIAKANAIAAEPYQRYGQPRLASATPFQKYAYEQTPDVAMSYKPALDQAMGMTQQSGQASALSQASPYIQAASARTPDMIGSYMNPYTSSVVDRIGDLSQRQLSENIIPTIQSQFIGGGSFGGSRSGEALGRSMRDLQESTLAQQAQTLERGYTQAGQQAAADQARMAQLGQLTGAISTQDLSRQLQAGEQLARQGALQQSLGLTGLGAIEGVGQQMQNQQQRSLDLAYQDFLGQRDYDREQIAFLNNAIRGLQIPTRSYTETVGPADTYVPGALSQAAQLGATVYGLGKLK